MQCRHSMTETREHTASWLPLKGSRGVGGQYFGRPEEWNMGFKGFLCEYSAVARFRRAQYPTSYAPSRSDETGTRLHQPYDMASHRVGSVAWWPMPAPTADQTREISSPSSKESWGARLLADETNKQSCLVQGCVCSRAASASIGESILV